MITSRLRQFTDEISAAIDCCMRGEMPDYAFTEDTLTDKVRSRLLSLYEAMELRQEAVTSERQDLGSYSLWQNTGRRTCIITSLCGMRLPMRFLLWDCRLWCRQSVCGLLTELLLLNGSGNRNKVSWRCAAGRKPAGNPAGSLTAILVLN